MADLALFVRSHTRIEGKEGVMKKLVLIALLGFVLLFGAGCRSWWPGRDGDKAACAGSDLAGAAIDGAESAVRLEREGFTVLDFRARRDEYDRVYVVGEVKNTGLGAKGVELQASLRDSDGRLLAVGHFYPASYTNIGPTETWPFAYSFGKHEDAVRAELRIVGAFRAMDGPGVAFLP